MVEARWHDTVIARSDDTVIVEGNHYFLREAVDASLLRPSATTSACPWKGTARYHTIAPPPAPAQAGEAPVRILLSDQQVALEPGQVWSEVGSQQLLTQSALAWKTRKIRLRYTC